MKTLKVSKPHELEQKSQADKFLVEGLIPSDSFGLIVGKPKTGKSFLLGELALSIATGTPFLRKYATKRGSVIFFNGEDNQSITRERLQKLCHGRFTRLEEVQNLHVITENSLKLDVVEDLDGLRKLVSEIHPSLLILDPFCRMFSGSENNSKSVDSVLSGLREIQRSFGCTILLAHHMRKGGSGQSAIRGSSALSAFYDFALFISKDKEIELNTIEFEFKGFAPIESISYRMLTSGSLCVLEVAFRSDWEVIRHEQTGDDSRTFETRKTLARVAVGSKEQKKFFHS